MNYYKINNLVDKFNNIDYKGLDINKIIAGSQVYPLDLTQNNMCLVGTNENIATNGDLVQITESEYNILKQQIQTSQAPGLTLENIKTTKIKEMNAEYEKVIYNTFQSNAFDGITMETYSCSESDQSRISGEVTVAITVKAGYSTEVLSWKNVNQDKCATWTADQMIKLGTDLHKFVTEKTDYLESLTVYINKLTTIDDVNKVTWGMTIPS